MIKQWNFLNEEIKEIDIELKELAKEDPELYMTYSSCPGIGRISAITLANELGDMHHFKSNKAYSYVRTDIEQIGCLRFGFSDF